MSESLIEKMLGLPEFEVTDFKQNDNDMGFYVQTKLRPHVCLVCGCYRPTLVIYKSRNQTVRDINALGKRCALIIKRRYYECRECGGHFAEHLDSVGDGERITKRLRFLIAMKAAYVPFVDLETEYQISDTTVRKAFLERIQALPKPSDLETPRILGIDEICLMKDNYNRKQPWAIIANGDILDQKDTSNVKQEKLARSWSYERLFPLSSLIAAYENNVKSRYELSEYLDLTESFIDEALTYYNDKYSPYIEVGQYIIYFSPLGVLKRL